jgi:hypothetical protein
MNHPTAQVCWPAALLVIGLLCSCGQPLPKGAYRVATTELDLNIE